MGQIGALRLGELGKKPGFLRVEPHRYDELGRMTVVYLYALLVDRVEVFGFHASHDDLSGSAAEEGPLVM